MGHCNLGRQGAAALRHALSANVTITHLNLCDNQLDSTVRACAFVCLKMNESLSGRMCVRVCLCVRKFVYVRTK